MKYCKSELGFLLFSLVKLQLYTEQVKIKNKAEILQLETE